MRRPLPPSELAAAAALAYIVYIIVISHTEPGSGWQALAQLALFGIGGILGHQYRDARAEREMHTAYMETARLMKVAFDAGRRKGQNEVMQEAHEMVREAETRKRTDQ